MMTHGFARRGKRIPEYEIWTQIIERCTNPKNQAWRHYGGRGIAIAPEWRHDFPAFFAAIGQRPNRRLVLDRINNDGNYEPGNVRWASRTISARNRRIVLKTHCKHGHEFTTANTKVVRWKGTATRLCRQCQRDHAAKYRRRALGQ